MEDTKTRQSSTTESDASQHSLSTEKRAMTEADLQEEDKTKLLIVAVRLGDRATIEHLLHQGFNINCEDAHKHTPLFHAVSLGHIDIVKFLLDKNAQIDHKNIEHNTPLCAAARAGHSDIAELLINRAKLGYVNEENTMGNTALFYAAYAGHSNIVELLCENGAYTDHRNEKGRVAILDAIDGDHEDIVKILLERGNHNYEKLCQYTQGRQDDDAIKNLILSYKESCTYYEVEEPDVRKSTSFFQKLQHLQHYSLFTQGLF